MSVGVDQTLGGLNFVTVRDRVEIYRELKRVIAEIYSPTAFMNRVRDTTQRMNISTKHLPNLWESRRIVRGFFSVSFFRAVTTPRYAVALPEKCLAVVMDGICKIRICPYYDGFLLALSQNGLANAAELDRSIDYAIHHASYPRR